LIAQAQHGDAKAFGRLYDLYAGRVYAFVRSRTKSAHDAEDVTATVFLKVWESIGSYSNAGVPFTAWLFRVARNTAVDEHRRDARRPTLVEEFPDQPSPQSTEAIVIARADADRLHDTVQLLTEEQAAVIALRYWSDLSIQETAEVLGKNANAVKQLQHRAVRSLARLLEKQENHDA